MGERKQAERGHGRCQEEAGKSALPAPASPWPAAGGVRRGCRFRSHPRSRSRHFLPGATFQAARVLAWEYSVFICASPMAEGRRREDEEEELRERRELGGPRRARGRVLSCYFAADCNEQNKPEHRSSSQGPLSSIRAVIKRSLMNSAQQKCPVEELLGLLFRVSFIEIGGAQRSPLWQLSH